MQPAVGEGAHLHGKGCVGAPDLGGRWSRLPCPRGAPHSTCALPRRAQLDPALLDGDFDPEEWDRKMAEAFGDEYYVSTTVVGLWRAAPGTPVDHHVHAAEATKERRTGCTQGFGAAGCVCLGSFLQEGEEEDLPGLLSRDAEQELEQLVGPVDDEDEEQEEEEEGGVDARSFAALRKKLAAGGVGAAGTADGDGDGDGQVRLSSVAFLARRLLQLRFAQRPGQRGGGCRHAVVGPVGAGAGGRGGRARRAAAAAGGVLPPGPRGRGGRRQDQVRCQAGGRAQDARTRTRLAELGCARLSFVGCVER